MKNILVIPEIIPEEQFKKVQEERAKRSNITNGENGSVRKSTHYSSKLKQQKNADEDPILRI